MVEEDGTGDMIFSVEPSVVSEAVAAEAVTPGHPVTLSAYTAGLWVPMDACRPGHDSVHAMRDILCRLYPTDVRAEGVGNTQSTVSS